MFGLSFGEVLLLAVVLIVVVGPRNLPQMMRSLARTVTKVKRTAYDLRAQSGIDEVLRKEGIEREVEQLRMLARGRILDVDFAAGEMRPAPKVSSSSSSLPDSANAALKAPADPYAEPPATTVNAEITLDSEAASGLVSPEKAALLPTEIALSPTEIGLPPVLPDDGRVARGSAETKGS